MDFLIYPPTLILTPPFIRFSENFPSPLLLGPTFIRHQRVLAYAGGFTSSYSRVRDLLATFMLIFFSYCFSSFAEEEALLLRL